MNTSEADVTTLILRFRDLVTAPGETLSLHRDLCIARGLTWWGWWNRADERVPYNLFVRLKFLAVTSKPTRIYLFDTRTLLSG